MSVHHLDPARHIPPAGGGHPSHRQPIKAMPAVLDVVTAISNPIRYRTRYDHYRAFERHMLQSGVRLTTVELAQGDRQFEITEAGNPRHVQLRTYHELWLKENLLNIGISRLPADWQYVAWIDADLTFQRPDWAQETLHALQHWDIVQPFSHSVNMGPDYQPIFDSHRKGENVQRKIVVSWLYALFHELERAEARTRGGHCYLKAVGDYVWHSGFAWAARRSAIQAIGGLLDWAILGSADRHMADMMTGPTSWARSLSPGYRKMLDVHAGRFRKLNGNFGYVPGLVTHHWHGKLVNRQYTDRWKILFKHAFDPATDLFRDENHLWQLTDSKPGLRDDIRRYFRARSEDSSEL